MVENYYSKNKLKIKNNEKLEKLISKYPKTKLLYYENVSKFELNDFKILGEILFEEKKYLILDKTIFYPEGGGQPSDFGEINGKKIKKVLKISGVVLHKI